MRIYKRGDKWWTSWTEGGETKRKTTGCTDRAAAKATADRWERERADPDHAAAVRATLTDAVKAFLDELRLADAPAGTINMYECKCGHLERLLPARLAQVDATSVDLYFSTRSKEHASKTRFVATTTLYKEWIALSQVLQGAQRKKLFKESIAPLRPKWVKPTSKARETFLTWDQADALLRHADASERPIAAFILATGARWGEAQRSQPSDLDRTGWLVYLRGTKTDAAGRTIPIPVRMRAWLEGVEAPFAQVAQLKLTQACKRAGVPTVTPNDLRRTFASLLVQGGTPLDVVAKLLGHTSTAMVYRVYGRFTPSTLARLVIAPMPPANDAPATAETTPEEPAAATENAVPPVYQSPPQRVEAKEATVYDLASFLAKLVGRAGLEPATYGLKVRSSTD